MTKAASLHAARVGTKFGGRGDGAVEEGDGVLVGVEHAFHLCMQIGVGSRRIIQESHARRGGFFQRGFENIANLPEPLWRHFPVLHSAQREQGKKQLTYTTRSMAEQPVTTLLMDWRKGNREAGKELLVRMQPELRRIAAGYMRMEHSGHTLQPTALLNELYLRLMGGALVEWQDRAHFLAVAAQVLRRILVDHAREKLAHKRGGGAPVTTLKEGAARTPSFDENLLDLHRALDELALMDGRAAQVIELRYFGGLTEKEAAEVLGISVATLKRDWEAGRAWLVDRLGWNLQAASSRPLLQAPA